MTIRVVVYLISQLFAKKNINFNSNGSMIHTSSRKLIHMRALVKKVNKSFVSRSIK